MAASYTQLNRWCLGLSVFFVLGTVLQWRPVFRASAEVASQQIEVPVTTPYEDLLDETDLAPVSFGGEAPPEQQVGDESVELDNQGGPIGSLAQLPAEINLAVPFTSQAPEKNWDQPWQDACEEAAVLMLDAYYAEYGLSPLFARDELLKMIAWEETQGWGGSISIDKVAQVAEQFATAKGLRQARIIENPTINDIKDRLAAGHPVVVVADGRALDNPYFSGDGPVYHALIIRGYTSSTFITNDPGTQHGEGFAYTHDNLMGAIRDWNGGDVATGRRAVLVLE